MNIERSFRTKPSVPCMYLIESRMSHQCKHTLDMYTRKSLQFIPSWHVLVY